MYLDSVPDELSTPYVPLGIHLVDGIKLLQVYDPNIVEEIGGEHCFKIDTPIYCITLCVENDQIISVLYDDQCGRNSSVGRERKIQLYLQRYGSPSNWELQLINESIRYWVNLSDKVAMVYNQQTDIIRINLYREEYTT